MKIKLDENLPHGAATFLTQKHEVQTAYEEGLTGSSDEELWQHAQHEERFLITQDLDFSDLRRFSPGSHYGILLLRLRSPSRANLINRISELFSNESVDEWRGCFVVATDRKVRVVKRR